MEERLLRYIRGEALEAEKQEIARWLDESPDNRREFMALRKLYDITLWNNIAGEGVVHKVKTHRFRRLVFEVAKIAAVFLVVFLGTRQISSQKPEEVQMQTIYVPPGQRAEISLSDGTLVWLNSRSTLKFPDRFEANARNVELDGEGYFAVKHDPSAPFTVQTSRYAIHVLGTEFNVKAYRNSSFFETALLKGSVEISSSVQNLRLRPNEVAIAYDNHLEASSISDLNYFKWREGLFCFENERIETLIDKLQLYYDIRIETRSPSLLQHRYSGKFRIKDGIEHVLRVLQLKHKFTYTKDEEKNLIIIH